MPPTSSPAPGVAGRSTRKKFLILGGGAVVLGSIIAASALSHGKKGLPVAIATVGHEDVVARVSCTGKTEAKRKVDISANVMGQIVNLAVREGDRVRKNQFLLQIDRTQLKAQTSGSEAALAALLADREASRTSFAQTEADFARAEKNYREKIVSEAEFQRERSLRDGAQATLAGVERRIEQARAGLEASRDSLSKTTIRSPIDGIVTALPVEEGEIAVIGTMNNAGTKLLTVSDMSEVEADMQVDETDVPRVKLGQKASITVDAFAGKTFDGIISEIGSSPIVKAGSSQEAVEFSVKIAFKSPPEGIRPGYSVSAEIETGERRGVIAIPVQALVVQDLAEKTANDEKKDDDSSSTTTKKTPHRTNDVEGVFRIDLGKARFVPVKTGLQGELNIEISEGLKDGEKIVTGPFRILRTLKDGDAIRPEDKPKGSKDKPAQKS